MEGAPGEAWTAAQIERNRSATIEELLERWATQTPMFAETIQSIGEGRPPFDCHTHEHDIRHAVGRPGNRDSLIIESMAAGLAVVDGCRVALDVVLGGRPIRSGPAAGPAAVTLEWITPFELFRSRPGRRSREQMRAWSWVGDDADIEAVLDVWAFFGPTEEPIVE